MKYIFILLVVIVLTGCLQSPDIINDIFPATTQTDNESSLSLCAEHKAELKNKTRSSVIIYREPIGIHDPFSIFGTAYIRAIQEPNRAGEELITPFLANIYRTIYPWNSELNVFEVIYDLFHNGTYSNWHTFSDVLISFLLTEESIALSDEKLYTELSNINQIFIFSGQSETRNYRLVAFNTNRRWDPNFTSWMDWSYFVQIWDDEHIWAQPLCEFIEFRFNNVVFVTSPNGDELVLLSG